MEKPCFKQQKSTVRKRKAAEEKLRETDVVSMPVCSTRRSEYKAQKMLINSELCNMTPY